MDQKYENFLDLVVYELYPRSFKDSNGDGIGDIPGVIEKLDYLVDLGINAIWLCPCFKSPNEDNGYDISDYRDIMDEFGTMEDIRRLIDEMHKRGMKLIMDLVPNHTSSQHKWFQESRKSRNNPYSDYYVWADKPFNNWTSFFSGGVWEYEPMRDQYYMHNFAVGQPDLNWDNPAVVKEMQDIVDFWVDMGVDGFRCDVIDMISKDYENNRHSFGPHLHEYINALFGREKTKHLFTVGECWADTLDEIYRHCAAERGELSTLFQFEHFTTFREDDWYIPKEDSLKNVRDILVKWQNLLQEKGLLYTLFTDNHDNNIFLSRAADDREKRYESATCLATMFFLLRGIPFIYQGQEFGLAESDYGDISYLRDIQGINKYHELLEEGMDPEEAVHYVNFNGRDNARRPMAWDDSEYVGFSECEPWIPVGNRVKEINLKTDMQAEKSVFRFYQALLRLRKENPAFRQGSFTELSSKDANYFVYRRELGEETFTVVCNFETESVIEVSGMTGQPVLKNYADRDAENKPFRPYEIAVYKTV